MINTIPFKCIFSEHAMFVQCLPNTFQTSMTLVQPWVDVVPCRVFTGFDFGIFTTIVIQ